MDNFLTALYFEKFQLTQKERRLMDNNTWEKSEQGRLDCVRNDQSISEVRQQQEMINRIITAYIDKIKSE